MIGRGLAVRRVHPEAEDLDVVIVESHTGSNLRQDQICGFGVPRQRQGPAGPVVGIEPLNVGNRRVDPVSIGSRVGCCCSDPVDKQVIRIGRGQALECGLPFRATGSGVDCLRFGEFRARGKQPRGRDRQRLPAWIGACAQFVDQGLHIRHPGLSGGLDQFVLFGSGIRIPARRRLQRLSGAFEFPFDRIDLGSGPFPVGYRKHEIGSVRVETSCRVGILRRQPLVLALQGVEGRSRSADGFEDGKTFLAQGEAVALGCERLCRVRTPAKALPYAIAVDFHPAYVEHRGRYGGMAA